VNKDYRDLLREKLNKRISLNAKYSLRAFARDLKISPGQLSLVLTGQKGISAEKAAQVFSAVGLDSEERKSYLLQVLKEHARSSKKRAHAEAQLRAIDSGKNLRLTQDAFEIISEWYHFAILQCLSLQEIRKCTTTAQQMKFISARLKLQDIQVKTAIERLLRLELIETKSQRFRVCRDTVIAAAGVPSAALRQFHTQILKKAIVAIENQTIEERYSDTVVLPILMQDFPEIRKDIARFQNNLMKKYGRVVQGDADQVYSLTQQFFKLTEQK
jgi:uncharacterized protein (TIGR02147 family)